LKYHFKTPLTDVDVRRLHVGDIVYLSGCVFTARDEAHRRLLDIDKKDVPFDPSKMGLYHCGPLMKKDRTGWKAVSAGPTTSSRMELFEHDFIKKFGVKIIVGKGGMGDRTRDALQRYKAVFVSFTGGAGALAADKIDSVKNVYWLEELGMPEAVWVFTVKNFGPLVVAIDSHGKSIYFRDIG